MEDGTRAEHPVFGAKLPLLQTLFASANKQTNKLDVKRKGCSFFSVGSNSAFVNKYFHRYL